MGNYACLHEVRGFPDGSAQKESACSAGDRGDVSLICGSGGPLEKEITNHSSILAWEIPWTEETSGLQSMKLQRGGHNWVTKNTGCEVRVSIYINWNFSKWEFPLLYHLLICSIMGTWYHESSIWDYNLILLNLFCYSNFSSFGHWELSQLVPLPFWHTSSTSFLKFLIEFSYFLVL